MSPFDPRLPIIAADAKVRPCHVFYVWHSVREMGRKFHVGACAQFTSLEVKHVEAIVVALEAHDAMPTKGARAVTAKASRLPEDWTIPDEWVEWACNKRRWQPEDVREQALRFANHWQSKSGKDAAKLDWHKTWQNWVIGSHVADGDYVPAAGKVTTESRARFLRDKIALYTRMGRESELEPMRKELAGLDDNVLPFERRTA